MRYKYINFNHYHQYYLNEQNRRNHFQKKFHFVIIQLIYQQFIHHIINSQ
jgi:hypothetical protein